MRGNDKATKNGKPGCEKNVDEDSTTLVEQADKTAEDRNNLIYGIGYREYCQSILNAQRLLGNNLEPQHGVTPCRIDTALQNGLSALGYAPQWALPTDCVHWEYQQEPLIVCNDGALHSDCNLYCKDTKNAPKEIDANLLTGVSDFYKHLQTAYQSALTIPPLPLLNPPKDASLVPPPPDYVATNPLSPDYAKALSSSGLDWPWWERPYAPGLIALPNCGGIIVDPTTATRKTDHEDWKTQSDLPYDFSIPKSGHRRPAAPKKTSDLEDSRKNQREPPKPNTWHKRSEILSSSSSGSSKVAASDNATVAESKLDVEEELVKDERNRSNLSASHVAPNCCWEDADMSGQYPGHSRPPVGTPPPQTVWNHLTMTQGQGKTGAGGRGGSGGAGGGGGGGVGGGGGGPPAHESLPRGAYERVQSDLTYLLSEVSGLNMHPTGLSGASLNPAGFYTHPSMARAASHLTSQLTPQLAHTQAPPTWHTPTVPSKSVTASNAPGNPLYSLQMLVDNRQNQNQYRNSPGSQSTLDLSATSEMAENYSRMTQDIPISLTARNVDKTGSRNGNIISPPIPLNGETSSDSGISSSVPTPNSVGEAVSLTTKEQQLLTNTPKITVKNFESNLKGVANLHDKMKEISVESFAQKVINLPPSVTIERVVTTAPEKKEMVIEQQQQSQQPTLKIKDSLSVIAQVPRNVLPVIVNLTSRMDKDVTDSPMRESSSERERKIDESVRSPKNLPKSRGAKKGVDSLLEKLEGGNKKLAGSSENIGSVIVAPIEDKDSSSSVKSMSPERQKSKSPSREDDVVSPAFSNDDSNDNTKQRRKRKLEKPVRLSKDSKTEVEDMELEPTEPREPRTCCESVISEEGAAPETVASVPTSTAVTVVVGPTQATPATAPISAAATATTVAPSVDATPATTMATTVTEASRVEEEKEEKSRIAEEKPTATEATEPGKSEDNERIKRRRSSEGPASNQTPTSQRTRRKSSDDATEFSKVTSPKPGGGGNNANPFNEVESELEKMFAGIVEDEDKAEETKTTEAMRDAKKEVVNATATAAGVALKREQQDGIEADGKPSSELANSNLTDVTSTVETKQPAKRAGKKAKVRGGKRKIARNSDNAFVASIDDVAVSKDNRKRRGGSKGSKKIVETPTKKAKKNSKPDGLREMAYDSGSNASSIRSRGPVVHVEGPRDSPLSVQVVNAPREEEEEKSKEKRKSVGNGNTGRSKRLSHQNDLDYRGKVSRAGLFSSTLSSRYDAHTTDSTWVCVFCKQGPHSVVPGDPARPHPNLAGPHIAPGTYTVPAGVLSDLFGPYLIGKERLEEGILSADEQEITTEQKKGGKNKRSLRYAGLADQFSAKMGKKKRNSMESSSSSGGGSFISGAFTGMTMLPGDEQRWEVWLHEQCALWAAGVYMAGGRVTGLQEAVWDSTKSICDSCGLTGANIGCVKRGCKAVTHYPCALTKSWLLDTSQYIPKCNLHRVT